MNPQEGKMRLDRLLASLGLCESREKARAIIMAGEVWVDGQRADKAGVRYRVDSDIVIKPSAPPFVSRGGTKLEHALDHFGFDPRDMVALDIGASTGGFTDCLLQRGCASVWAVDVGYGQIHQRLRDDPRVRVLERVNARYLTSEHIRAPVDLVVMDVSFISITLIIPAVMRLMKPEASLISLIKPQFEAGRAQVRRGVVRDKKTHQQVLRRITDWLSSNGFLVAGLTHSPITGPRGNMEFFVHATLDDRCDRSAIDVESVVECAHRFFDQAARSPSKGAHAGLGEL